MPLKFTRSGTIGSFAVVAAFTLPGLIYSWIEPSLEKDKDESEKLTIDVDFDASDKRTRKVYENYRNTALCDTLFYVGKEQKMICVIGSNLAMQSIYFMKLLYNNNFRKSRKQAILTNKCESLDVEEETMSIDAEYFSEIDLDQASDENLLNEISSYFQGSDGKQAEAFVAIQID